MSNDDKARFEAWWYGSKYMQVVFSSDASKQIAWDGYQAALASRLEQDDLKGNDES